MGIYDLKTNKLSFEINTSPLKLKRIIHNDNTENCELIDSEFFIIKWDKKIYSASGFQIISVENREDGRYKLLRIELEQKDAGIGSVISLLADKDDTVEFILQIWDKTKKPARYASLKLPFLTDGQMLGLKNSEFRAPAMPFITQNGDAILDPHSTCAPVMSFVRLDGLGLDLTFDIPHDVNTQNSTRELPRIKSLDQLLKYETTIRLNNFPAVVMQMRFTAVGNGWLETFQTTKRKARAKVDLDNYKRDELNWYNKVFLHQFTYAYGKEAYDYATNRMNLEKLLDEGKEFGGYDLICLWHQYPRLGLDPRSQWDFFDDFPGGVDGLAELVKTCHKYGTRLTIPYKPWDAPSNLSMDETTDRLVDIVKKTDIDGFFLDTMSNVPTQFRKAVDKIKPGCIFCTELQPMDGETLETLTGSWQQSAPLPYQVPILRYVFPEHHSPFISRWSIDENRDDIIKKAIMNGSGLVIWQDIFGTWLPYEERQKNDVRKWKNIWQSNKEYFLSDDVIPLWPELNKNLVINAFPSEKDSSVIFTVYNNSNDGVNGIITKNMFTDAKTINDLWDPSTNAWLKDGNIYAQLRPGQVAILKVY